MADLFHGEAVARAWLRGASSDAEPSSTEPSSTNPPPTKSSPAAGNHHVTERGETKAPTETTQGCWLLELPVEIRLAIYDLLLVSRYGPEDDPSGVVTNRRKAIVVAPGGDARAFRRNLGSITILQTCKQVYLEAVSTLYSKNLFHIHIPDALPRLIDQIGHANTTLIQSLSLYLHFNADKDSWLRLLRTLPKTTRGLKSVRVRWSGSSWTRHEGLGRDIAFAQALAGLSKLGLEQLKLGGCYAKPWPAYFRDKFGARVVEADDGHEYIVEADGRRTLHKYVLEEFTKYQIGTESLNPWGDESDEEAADEEAVDDAGAP